MLGKIEEFLKSFGDRHLLSDDQLAELLSPAKEVVNGLSTDELRRDGNLRKYIAGEMNRLRCSHASQLMD